MTYDRDQYRSQQVLDYISLLYPELTKDFSDCSVLDIGSGLGTVAMSLAQYASSVVGIELTSHLVEKARIETRKRGLSNISFENMSAFDLIESHDYDVVILSDVLEHVSDQRKLLMKCLGAMAPTGVLYLNTPNKWFPFEPHKRMLFLSWLPKRLANKYAAAFGRSSYDEYHLLSHRELIALLDDLPIVYSFKVQRNPTRLMYRIGNRLVTKAPFLWRFANAFQIVVTFKRA